MTRQSLAELELLVILAALKLGPEDAYAVSISDLIESTTGRAVRRANVHTTLRRLEEKGLVTTRLGDPRPERGGKPRRLVAVADAGVGAARVSAGAVRDLSAGLGHAFWEPA